MAHPVILLHALAPPKPEPGAPCNGCGVCCAWQPCPLGMLVSRRRSGRCSALRWDAAGAHYRCGLLAAPAQGRPAWAVWLRSAWQRLARRWIAAGAGCDCQAEVAPGSGAAA